MARTEQAGESEKGRDPSSYPLHPLSTALTVAEVVKDLGGTNRPVSKSLIASHLKVPEGQVLNQRIGSTRAFGMIQGRGEYMLTEMAKQYFFPHHENER